MGAVLSDIFISYSSDDRARARIFAEAFAAAGLSVWWDDGLRAGDAYDQKIEQALKSAKAVVVLWSPSSVESRWVRAEATLADRCKTLAPVTIEPCDRPIMFELTHTAELSHWRGDSKDKAWQAFLADVGRMVAADPAAPEAGSAPAPPKTPPKAPQASPDRRLLIGGGAALLLAGGGAAWWRLGGASPAAPSPSAPATPPTVAVLPFANLSGDPEQAYLADGIAEEIRSSLSLVPGLTVIGRVSSERFRGSIDPAKVSADLGAAAILTGSVRRSPSTIRITAQLIDGRTGAERWSNTFDRPAGDALAIQTDIARAVGENLGVRLMAMAGTVDIGTTSNAEAQDLYIKARQLGRQKGEASTRQRLILLDRALALDPRYANAWAARSVTLGNLWGFTSDVSTRRAMARDGLAAARRAVALAPRSGYANIALSGVHMGRGQTAQALAFTEAALRFGSGDNATLQNAAVGMTFIYPLRAIDLINTATARDPFSPGLPTIKGEALLALRRYADATAAFKLAESLGNDTWRSRVSLMILTGDLAGARANLPKVLYAHFRLYLGACLAVRTGALAEADRLIAELATLDDDLAGISRAIALAQRGRLGDAITSLERAIAAQNPQIPAMLFEAFLDPLWPDPRFQALLARLFPADAIAARARLVGKL